MPSRALVAENDSGTRRLLSVLLTRLGYQVDALATGSDAVLLLEEIRYDLVLVDLFLPRTSGTDVLEWLKANRPEDLGRANMLSSAPPAFDARVRVTFPQVRVLPKPFDLDEIVGVAEAARPPSEPPALSTRQEFARRSVAAGAKTGVLVRSDGAALTLVHAFGYSAEAIARWFPLQVSDPFPLTMCVRDRQPHWIASLKKAAHEFPSLEAVLRKNGSEALASVPVVRGGVVIGAAGWTFREPQLFDSAEQQAFVHIASDAATAIEAA